ncbi:MAG: hypothetical protein P8X74_09125 [Reinekea sp.]
MSASDSAKIRTEVPIPLTEKTIPTRFVSFALQDKGIDTYKANEMLGFDHDLRDFTPAIHMLNALGLHRIRLLTNNPHKAKELTAAGVEVTECVETGVYVNQHNANYLRAKVEQQQHSIKLRDTSED